MYTMCISTQINRIFGSFFLLGPVRSRCLKTTKKVLLTLRASERASYVYILSGQKFIKNAKNANGQFGELKIAVKP